MAKLGRPKGQLKTVEAPAIPAEPEAEPKADVAISTPPLSTPKAVDLMPFVKHLQAQLEAKNTENIRLHEELKNATQRIREMQGSKAIPDVKVKSKPKSDDEVRKEALISSIGKPYLEYTDSEKIAVEREVRRYLNRDGGKKVKDKDGSELVIPYYRDGLAPAELNRAKELCERTGRDAERPKWDLSVNVAM